MINITSNGNGVVFEGKNKLSVPLNSLILVIEKESDIVMFKSATDYGTILQDKWQNITINGNAVTKDTIASEFDYVSNKETSGGGGGGSVDVIVTDTLPEVGRENVIYLIPSQNPTTSNIKDEYMFIQGKWELIGSSSLDLTDYITESELNSKGYITTTQADSKYQPKGNYITEIPSEYVTETELDGKGYATEEQLALKADITSVPTVQTSYSGNEKKFIYAAGNNDANETKNVISDLKVSNGKKLSLSKYFWGQEKFISYTLDIRNASADKDGAMSAEDKVKLDSIDTSTFATKDELSLKANTSDLSDFVTKTSAESTYAKKSEIPSLEGYLTESDASNTYATKAELNGKVDDAEIADMATKTWVGEQGYLTSHQDISNLATKQELTSGLGTKQDKGDYALRSEIPDVSEFITNSVNNLVNYYKKSETYTQAEVNSLIGAITTISFEVVDALPDVGEDNKIYLIPNAEQAENNVKDEFIYVDAKWEKIGSTSVDLSNYFNKEEINAKLELKLDKAAYETDKGTFALKTEIPDVSGLLSKTEASATYQPIGEYLTSIPAEYVTDTELNAKGYLTSIPSEYVTDTELNAKGYKKVEYKTQAEYDALATKEPDVLYVITDAEATDASTLLSKDEASTTYQPIGEYLTSIPSEYVTDTELNAKGYLTESEASTTYALQTALQAALDRIAALEAQITTINNQVQAINTGLDNINGEVIE